MCASQKVRTLSMYCHKTLIYVCFKGEMGTGAYCIALCRYLQRSPKSWIPFCTNTAVKEPRQRIIYNYCVQVILVNVSCVRALNHTSWYKLQCFAAAEFIFICLFCNRHYFLFATHLIFLYSPRQVVRTSMWTLSGYASRGLISKLGCPKYFLYVIK